MGAAAADGDAGLCAGLHLYRFPAIRRTAANGLRESFGWQKGDYWFPEVRSLGGAIVLFSCVLYPYVYLLVRTAFLERAGGMIEAARALGLNPWQGFWRVSIPLARPAIAAGMALALMETLADYGTVAYFAVQTFTTGIYRAWFSLGDRIAAAQLAAALLGFVALLILLERISRGRARYHDSSGRRRATRQVLTGWHALLAQIGCAIPVVIGFVLPALLLLRLAMGDAGEEGAGFAGRFLMLARNSLPWRHWRPGWRRCWRCCSALPRATARRCRRWRAVSSAWATRCRVR
jgi:iron(III) transport system permease protein